MTEGVRTLPRVLFAIGGLGAGGSENQFTEVICRLHGIELDTQVLVGVADPGRRLDRLRDTGVPITEVGEVRLKRPWTAVGRAYRQWRTLRRSRPHAVYGWLEETALFLVPMCRILGIPFVAARRNASGARIERLRPFAYGVQRAEQAARLVTCNSDAVLEHARSRGIAQQRLRHVPNALVARPAVEPPPEPPVRLGYLGGIRPEKGHFRLLKVLSFLPDELDWVAKVGGDGPLLEAVRADARRLGLEDRVHFLGEVPDAASFWDDCHVGVLLSDMEGSPNSMLEAANAARPLLATAVGGNIEMVSELTGFAVDPNDEREAAARLEQLIRDSALRARLGAAARRLTLLRHDPDVVARQHLAALREVL